jgi:hypothetical protein
MSQRNVSCLRKGEDREEEFKLLFLIKNLKYMMIANTSSTCEAALVLNPVYVLA